MQIQLLGTAAGGGFPQWNCACRNCNAVRRGEFPAKARSQLQVAVAASSGGWCLLNASPDLRYQIESSPSLYPSGPIRNSPIQGVVLTGGDLDQSLGLLLLREFQPFEIFATNSIRKLLVEDNSIFAVLQRINDQARWTKIVPGAAFELRPNVSSQGIDCLPVPVGNSYPGYATAARSAELVRNEALLGLILTSGSGRKLGYFPVVQEINASLLAQLDSVDVLLFDGTF